jgi:hypothetical protein
MFYPLKDYCKEAYLLNQAHLRAQFTGEFRRPRKGEWYLSGAIVEAYLALNDMTTPYHIARIVLTERTIKETIIGEVTS